MIIRLPICKVGLFTGGPKKTDYSVYLNTNFIHELIDQTDYREVRYYSWRGTTDSYTTLWSMDELVTLINGRTCIC